MANLQGLIIIKIFFIKFIIKVEPLNVEEKIKVTEGFLAQYGKKLNPQQLSLIIKSPQSSNPLYLRTLLEEVKKINLFLFLK
jgi:hypothetical protein